MDLESITSNEVSEKPSLCRNDHETSRERHNKSAPGNSIDHRQDNDTIVTMHIEEEKSTRLENRNVKLDTESLSQATSP